MKLPFEVVYNVNFFQKEMTTQILYGIFIGIILLACILNLVFYFFLKEPYFLLYVLYMFFTLLFNLFLSGHIFSLVWLSYGEWQNLAFLQNFNLIFVLALLFVLKFLDLKNLSPANYLVFKIAFGVHLAISAMIFLGDYALLNALLELDALLFLLWVLYLGVLSWKSGNRPARFFLVAYFIYLLMVLPIILMSFALVTESFLTRHGTELAVLLEAIFLAFALADRYQYERQHITAEKDLAQQRAVRIQQDAHARLEKEVSQRTYELRKTNEELFQKNKEILLQKYDIDQKNKALEKVNRNKDKFFSILAHDVRAPLNSLITFTSLLENDQNLLSEEESLLLRKGLNQQVKNLHNMLDNVLDWSRSQLGGIRLSLKEANPMKHIESVVNLLAPTAAQKGVKLYSLVIHSPEVMADEQALETILRNLIGNAIKFTPEGGTVTVSTSELGGMLVFAITDTGTGLSEDLQKSLFLTKEKKPIPGTAGEKGTGLGLSICQEFVQALSGEIWVESQQGQGSVFYFSLPMICSSKEIKPEKAKAI